MALKLGDLLLNEKIITPEQLEEALKIQVIFGNRLGSILVQMGYVDAEALAKLLSRKLDVPCVTKRELVAVLPDLIDSFPLNLVERYRVVPFRLQGNRLSVAMTDPTDLKALEEISFVTGYIVQPFIAPDVYISRALAKYYRFNTGDIRYKILAEKHRPIDRPVQQPIEQKQELKLTQEPAATITMPGYNEAGELLQMTIPAEFEGFGALPDFGETTAFDSRSRYTVDSLSLDFADARSRDDVANVFITYLGQEFVTGALLIVRGNVATGWCAISNGEQIASFKDVSVLLSKPSILREVLDTKTFVMGSLVATAENRQLLAILKVSPDKPLLAIPLIMLNKVVAVVIVSAEMDSLSRRLNELQKLVRKASLAFEMLIIRNKILVT